MLLDLFKLRLDEKLNPSSSEFEFFLKIEKATISPQHVTKMMVSMLYNQDFIAPVVTFS